ncbi:MAG TPA: hypothetical protein PLA43_12185 [Bryobacteraceae bacterium]|nr:hypothetical protein [Bryobacteraceae bacterium]HOL71278.1 hypothetical protein [Bryobacteraceae bacterium]HOQ46150.1 hypothetical protein [Bryobacteraceae bacterium]HPQ14016.1 hypothetical protein [Bryobacteraceae bacterium]HPU72709.1 hypothetical protein [Bryobacteraceae bacterium]
MSEQRQFISIWLFVGVLLLIYGVLIMGSGIYHLVNPPAQETVLAELHAPIWWGALLTVLGAVYTIAFRPRR